MEYTGNLPTTSPNTNKARTQTSGFYFHVSLNSYFSILK